jgi:hypothetical protein
MSSLARSFDVEQQTPAPNVSQKRAFGLGLLTGGLAFVALATVALFQTQKHESPSGSSFTTAGVNAASVPGVNDWEWENSARYVAGELNEAQLGLANLKRAVRDRSMMAEVAQWLRHRDGQAQYIAMMANPAFQAQAKEVAETLKKNGEMPNIFQWQNYAVYWKEQANTVAQQEAATGFNLPSGAAATSHATNSHRADVKMTALDDLKADAQKAFPPGFFDPLKLSEREFWGQSNEATIGFLRHAEIKHGRVAMAGFVGYCLHENGVHFPWSPFDNPAFQGLSAPALWDAIPQQARLHIVVTVGFLEWWSETSFVLEQEGQKHYMRGGKPGYFPTFDNLPHPVPANLYDPFGLSSTMSAEKKAYRLNAELNNGRLAMLGLISLISEAKVPGSVPWLNGLIKSYSGNLIKDPWGKDMLAPTMYDGVNMANTW